jgi:hypothetical protein
VENLKTED